MQETLFKFDPNASDAPLPRGRYDAQVTDAEVRTSRAGNHMLQVTLRTYSSEGQTVFLRDFLVNTPRMKWKIKRFCQALGLDFEHGTIDPTVLRGRDVTLEVGVEEDLRGRDRNTVADYVPAFDFRPEGAKAAAATQPQSGASGAGGEDRPQSSEARRSEGSDEEHIPF